MFDPFSACYENRKKIVRAMIADGVFGHPITSHLSEQEVSSNVASMLRIRVDIDGIVKDYSFHPLIGCAHNYPDLELFHEVYAAMSPRGVDANILMAASLLILFKFGALLPSPYFHLDNLKTWCIICPVSGESIRFEKCEKLLFERHPGCDFSAIAKFVDPVNLAWHYFFAPREECYDITKRYQDLNPSFIFAYLLFKILDEPISTDEFNDFVTEPMARHLLPLLLSTFDNLSPSKKFQLDSYHPPIIATQESFTRAIEMFYSHPLLCPRLLHFINKIITDHLGSDVHAEESFCQRIMTVPVAQIQTAPIEARVNFFRLYFKTTVMKCHDLNQLIDFETPAALFKHLFDQEGVFPRISLSCS